MKDGLDSHTAERVAIRRAAHQLLDRPPILDDPLAIRVIRPDLARALLDDPNAFDRSPLSPYLRAFFAIRSRFAEDALAVAVAAGVRQYLVLGAGYDTFAYRNPFADLRVFEVDYPATQAAKRARLADAGIAVPDNVSFVGVDFTTTTLRDALNAARFDQSAPAFCSWLGVIVYLELAAIEDTLRVIASLPSGTSITFDYGVPPASLGWRSRLVVEQMSRRVAAVGEPWRTYLSPDDVRTLAHRVGFRTVEEFGAADLAARYLAGRNDLRLGEAGRIALLRV